ncbi:MAG: response regulator [Eubacterium sp.]
MQIVGSATNGVKALELVEKLYNLTLLTDIKMPYMNGLELSRRLNDEYRNVHIIIFTGFDEFDYAKKQCILK